MVWLNVNLCRGVSIAYMDVKLQNNCFLKYVSNHSTSHKLQTMFLVILHFLLPASKFQELFPLLLGLCLINQATLIKMMTTFVQVLKNHDFQKFSKILLDKMTLKCEIDSLQPPG